MKSLILSALICLCLFAKAQNFIENQFVFGGLGSLEPVKIIAKDGTLFSWFRLASIGGVGNLDFEDPGCAGIGTLLIRHDLEGNSIWQKNICGIGGDSPTDMIDVGDGLILSIASSSNENTGNKTVPTFKGPNHPSNLATLPSFWIVKIDYEGNILWQKSYGSYQVDWPLNLASDNDGKIFIVGYSYIEYGGFSTNITGNKTAPNKGRMDTWVLLLNQNGDEIWQKTLGVNTPDASSVTAHGGAALPNGNFLTSSTSSYSGISGDKTIESFGNANAWLVCLDANGNQLWDKIYGGDDVENSAHILIEDEFVYYIMESSSGVAGNRTSPTKGIQDVLVFKLDFEGNIINQSNFGVDGAVSLETAYLHENRIIIGAKTEAQEPSIDKSEPSRGGTDYWLLSLDSESLSLINEKTYGGADNDDVKSMIFYDNHLFLSGWSSSDVSGDKTVPNFGFVDAWILKVNPTHLLTIDEQILINSTIFPNPASNQIIISFTEPTKLNKAVLYDLSGKVVLEQDLSASLEANYVLNTHGLASGVYSLSLVGDGFVKTQQVVVQ